MFILLLLLTSGMPALACELDAPTARLPGYSDDKAEERAQKLWSDWEIIYHHQRTEELMAEAPNYYLARVIAVEKSADGFTHRVKIEPLRALKGELPHGVQSLIGYLPSSCGQANGDGDAAYAQVSDLVIIFVNVAKRPTRPNGIDSLKVEDVRNIELLDQVQAWLTAQPGYVPYD